MSPAKLFQRKNEDAGEQPGGGQKAKPVKKSAAQPVKTKKTDVAKKTPKKPEESRMDWLNQFRQYLRDVGYELRKVIWPSRKETIGSTSVVLVIVILSGIFLGVIDLLLSRIVRLLVG